MNKKSKNLNEQDVSFSEFVANSEQEDKLYKKQINPQKINKSPTPNFFQPAIIQNSKKEQEISNDFFSTQSRKVTGIKGKKCLCMKQKPRNYLQKEDKKEMTKEEHIKNNRFYLLNEQEKQKAIQELWNWAIKKVIRDNKCKFILKNLFAKSTTNKQIKHKCLIIPGSNINIIWNTIMLLLLLYIALVPPFLVSFLMEIPPIFFIIEAVVNAIYFLDICVNFFTAYYQKTILITDKKRIAVKYLHTYFLIDLISCIPFDMLINTDDSTPMLSRLLILLSLLKLLKLGKLMKLIQIFIDKVFINFRIRPGIYKLFIFSFCIEMGRALVALVSLVFIAHWFGCAWFLTARIANFSWDTWVVRIAIMDLSIWEQYLVAIYWVFSTLTTVGYGDVVAITISERLICLLLMSFGIALYSSLFQPMDETQKKLRRQMMTLAIFAKKNNLPNQIITKIQQHFNLHADDYFENLEEKCLVEELPTHLRAEVIHNTYGRTFSKIKLFYKQPAEFIWKMATKMNNFSTKPGEVLYKIGDSSEEIYFMKSGIVTLFDSNKKIIRTYSHNTYFGEIEVIENIPREYTAISEGINEMASITKKDFAKILDEYPEIYNQVVKTITLRKIPTQIESQYVSLRQSGSRKGQIHVGSHNCSSIESESSFSDIEKVQSSKVKTLRIPIPEVNLLSPGSALQATKLGLLTPKNSLYRIGLSSFNSPREPKDTKRISIASHKSRRESNVESRRGSELKRLASRERETIVPKLSDYNKWKAGIKVREHFIIDEEMYKEMKFIENKIGESLKTITLIGQTIITKHDEGDDKEIWTDIPEIFVTTEREKQMNINTEKSLQKENVLEESKNKEKNIFKQAKQLYKINLKLNSLFCFFKYWDKIKREYAASMG